MMYGSGAIHNICACSLAVDSHLVNYNKDHDEKKHTANTTWSLKLWSCQLAKTSLIKLKFKSEKFKSKSCRWCC